MSDLRGYHDPVRDEEVEATMNDWHYRQIMGVRTPRREELATGRQEQQERPVWQQLVYR